MAVKLIAKATRQAWTRGDAVSRRVVLDETVISASIRLSLDLVHRELSPLARTSTNCMALLFHYTRKRSLHPISSNQYRPNKSPYPPTTPCTSRLIPGLADPQPILQRSLCYGSNCCGAPCLPNFHSPLTVPWRPEVTQQSKQGIIVLINGHVP
ncbi:hypothetical protein RRG08_004763 [Elysia crispata]|uniref:Uncharacterized protein n=1 Tax=Elysia crispata TaxID=231223 RepID=A0AAE1AIV7_9GAST|nr:hypothetical protein RRG08_004763 [Elysia crispata]